MCSSGCKMKAFAFCGVEAHLVHSTPPLDALGNELRQCTGTLAESVDDVREDVVRVFLEIDAGWYEGVDVGSKQDEENGTENAALDDAGFDVRPLGSKLAALDSLSPAREVCR